MTLETRLAVFACCLLAITALLSSTAPSRAAPVTVTDIAGRQVTFEKMPGKIILGEGRMMYGIAPLVDGNPFEKIVGWKDDLIKYDPDAFRKFKTAFPKDAARMINFGNPYAGDFSIEAVLNAKTDLVLLDLGNLFKAKEPG